MKAKTPLYLIAPALLLPLSHAAPVFSWETGNEGWVQSEGNPTVTGDETTIAASTIGVTDGTKSLAITTPMGVTNGAHGMWYATPTEINLDQPTRQALFTGATDLQLDVTYPNPGYTSWWSAPSVELIIQGDGVPWTTLGVKEVPVDGASQTFTWALTVGQAAALANGSWGQMIMKFTYGNGGSSTPHATFHVDNLRSTVFIEPPPSVTHFWKGDVSGSWTGLNWSEDAAGTVATPALTTDGTAAIAFAAEGAGNLATTLDANQNILSMVSRAASGPVAIGGTHNLTLGEDGILVEAGGGPVTINTTGHVILGAAQLWANNSNDVLTVSSQVSGSHKLTTGGSGSIFLTEANSHSGGTEVQQGFLILGHEQALGAATATATVSGGALDLNGLSPTLGGIAGSLGGAITNRAPVPVTLTLDDEAGSTFNGAINEGPTGALAFVKKGSGPLALGGAGNFTGDFTIEEGEVTANSGIFGAPNASNFGNAQIQGRTVTVESSASLTFNSNNVLGNQQASFPDLPTFVLNGSTLHATRYNLIGNLTLNGGTLSHGSTDSGSYLGYQFKGQIDAVGTTESYIVTTNGKGNHLSDETVFNVAAATGRLIVSAPLVNQSGDFANAPGGLSKTGPGTLLLDGFNGYSGPTKVQEGTLSLSTASLSDVATVEISEDAVLDLYFGGEDTVGKVIVDGVPKGTGSFGALLSGADHELEQITGTGILVVAPDPFLAWIGDYPGLTGQNATKTADPDHDGLSNLEEFALDGNPDSGAASGKLSARLAAIGPDRALVLTLPVRTGAVLSGTAPIYLTAEGCVYQIGGSNDLVTPDQGISEVFPALTGDPVLPELNPGWTYRSFRLNGNVGGGNPRGPKGFLRAVITESN